MTITRRDTLKYTGAAIAVMSGGRTASAGTRAESNAYAVRSGPMPVPYLPRRGYADGTLRDRSTSATPVKEGPWFCAPRRP